MDSKEPIVIKHPGLLHKHLNIPAGQPIPVQRLHEALQSTNPAIRKEANFALNFSHPIGGEK